MFSIKKSLLKRNQFLSISQITRGSMRCLLCKMKTQISEPICTACLQYFPELGPACVSCATPIADMKCLYCGQCIINPPDLDRVIIPYQFDEPLRTVLHEFKYREGLYLAKFLSQKILKLVPSDYTTDCVIPVPMHAKKLRERGFNQAALLARLIAKALQCPLELLLCKKIINTPAQAGLDAVLRKKNLRDAFHIELIHYKHVTLVDDLMTTGSTANEIARLLKLQGVERVDLFCCAKTCFTHHKAS